MYNSLFGNAYAYTIAVQCGDPMVSRLCAACDAGNAFANSVVYVDAAGAPHSDGDARPNVYRNASADRNRCAAHNDAERDVHGDA